MHTVHNRRKKCSIFRAHDCIIHGISLKVPQMAQTHSTNETRRRAKRNVSPPGCATSRLRPATLVHFLSYANAVYRMSPKIIFVPKGNKTGKLISDWSSAAIVLSRCSINRENLVQIGPIDFEIIGRAGIVKNSMMQMQITDAGQSTTLARPAAPLAACYQWHPCTSYSTPPSVTGT